LATVVAGNGKNGGKLTGRILDSDMHDVARFLNRILGLFPDIQNRQVFSEHKFLPLHLHLVRQLTDILNMTDYLIFSQAYLI
jgi:hypothetical protein